MVAANTARARTSGRLSTARRPYRTSNGAPPRPARGACLQRRLQAPRETGACLRQVHSRRPAIDVPTPSARPDVLPFVHPSRNQPRANALTAARARRRRPWHSRRRRVGRDAPERRLVPLAVASPAIATTSAWTISLLHLVLFDGQSARTASSTASRRVGRLRRHSEPEHDARTAVPSVR
jgi:hypothetical protein